MPSWPMMVPKEDVIRLDETRKDELRQYTDRVGLVEEQLREVQKIAQRGIEAINHGANVDELRLFFRDIQSGARRRA